MRFLVYIYSLAFVATLAIMVIWPKLGDTGRIRIKDFLASVGLVGVIALFGVTFYTMFAVSIRSGLIMIGLVGLFSLANKLANDDDWQAFVEQAGAAIKAEINKFKPKRTEQLPLIKFRRSQQ